MLADLPFEPLPGQGPLSLEITPVGTIEPGDLQEMFQQAREDYAKSKQNQTLKRKPVAA